MPQLLRFLLPLFALVLFHSCDSVERPDRWREDPHAIVPQRNVLLVDFTGQRCSNCPAAADLVHSLTAGAAGARIIPVAVHGGPLALQSQSSPVGLANDDSRRLTDSAAVSRGRWAARPCRTRRTAPPRSVEQRPRRPTHPRCRPPRATIAPPPPRK